MGSHAAQAMAAAVAAEQVDLKGALSWHLTGNHFPPLPYEYVEPLYTALVLVANNLPTDVVEIPEGIQPVPGRAVENDEGVLVIQAADLVEACHAWSFLPEEDQ